MEAGGGMRKLLLEISQLMMVVTGVHTAQVVRNRVCICLKSSIRFFVDSLKIGKRNVQNDSKVNCLSNLKNKGYELGWSGQVQDPERLSLKGQKQPVRQVSSRTLCPHLMTLTKTLAVCSRNFSKNMDCLWSECGSSLVSLT